jgi:hypothetical protein
MFTRLRSPGNYLVGTGSEMATTSMFYCVGCARFCERTTCVGRGAPSERHTIAEWCEVVFAGGAGTLIRLHRVLGAEVPINLNVSEKDQRDG